MSEALDIVIIGLSLSSSWGNGHATTYRGMLRGLHALGHRVTFLERDVPWYAAHRDLPSPDFCELHYYQSLDELVGRFAARIQEADAVIIGSYVPEGPQVIDAVHALRPKRLAFYDIDTPITVARLKKGDEEYLAARQVPLFDVYFSFTGGPTLRQLENEFGAPRAEALYCSVDDKRYENTGEATVWDLGYLGTYSDDRQPTLKQLLIEPARRLPHLRFVVAGPQYPDSIDWPANVERIDHLPPAEHPSFYSRQRFTLNVTRADMIAAGWSPSVRLFEAAACGTAIISDFWEGLDDLLPFGEAVAIARSSDEVVALLTGSSEEQRLQMAASAKKRVLQGHTGHARAAELVGYLRDVAPERSSSRSHASKASFRETA
ncbi:CgeB family protein [Tianweitania sediminis]|uniref:Glycosyltransferase n=1 Tax=Tianweitania sediminis TaxID=1502156 RepID=A0A8J7RRR2_9HYPH|nr:glycosyltransferase [Tianweitania sediminis]